MILSKALGVWQQLWLPPALQLKVAQPLLAYWLGWIVPVNVNDLHPKAGSDPQN
ncbi:MAG: hypothetical protein MUC85_06575 [Anaerolineales bacterium]|jgi:hypothetical protein|nr:hypothetical protein [Anaerolineales bacterium]